LRDFGGERRVMCDHPPWITVRAGHSHGSSPTKLVCKKIGSLRFADVMADARCWTVTLGTCWRRQQLGSEFRGDKGSPADAFQSL
jgi:hypothetical protein